MNEDLKRLREIIDHGPHFAWIGHDALQWLRRLVAQLEKVEEQREQMEAKTK